MESILKIYNSVIGFCKRFPEQITVISLFILFYFIFFHNIGTYSLMDVDETRYVAMARDMFHSKDFMTLYLNGQFFFEKPPLYFWQECLSFALFGKVNEWTARFPVSLLGFILSFLVYFTSKHWVNRKFGIITSIILATSLEFIMLAKYAILDIVLTFYVGLALLCYFNVYFCQEKNKKYFWWAFYLFTGLAVMAKGIPGVAIPFGVVFFTSILAKKFKEIFKPIYLFPGLILFSLIILPWHILMLKTHNPLFFDEYIIKHHLQRFLNTENNEIGRKQPFYYYFLVILWGFIPWVFSVISVFTEKCLNLKKQNYIEKIKSFNFETLSNLQKIVVLNSVAAIFIMLFFSSSSTKLVTYILPIYYPLAMITGYIWMNYIEDKKYEKPINISTKIFGWIIAVAGVVAIFAPYFLPQQLNSDISNVRWFSVICFIIFGCGILLFVRHKKYILVFLSYALFMTVISAFGTGEFFKVDYKFGQDDLVNFAKYAKDNGYNITAYGLNRKYSLLYYNEKPVNYEEFDLENVDYDSIKTNIQKDKSVVIFKSKVFDEIKDNINYETVNQGRRYIMIKN